MEETSAPSKRSGKRAWDKVWREADERWRVINDVDFQNRRDARDDAAFVWKKGAQWPDRIRLDREASDRPCLEINQLPQFIKHVVNDMRQNRPAIKIRPTSDQQKQQAEIVEGLIRQIQYESQASSVIDTGFEQAVTGGRGYWRIVTDYEDDQSFNQCIYLRRIPDPMAVYMDPNYQEADASDIEWCFVAEALTKDEFKAAWPKAQPLDWAGMDTQTVEAKWYDGQNRVVVADYFRKRYTERTCCLMSDGSQKWKDELGEPDDKEGAPEGASDSYGGVYVMRERQSRDCVVEWFKVYGGGVLEQYEWAGKHIPIVMCVAEEAIIDGKRIYQGLIRRAKDIQTMFNFWQTRATENLALAPNAQWLVPDEAIEGYETVWDEANLKMRTRLPYRHDPTRPPPQRIEPAQQQAGILEQSNQCRQDFYTTIGIYPPTLAKESQEVSGIAIDYRQQQADRSTFHFADNLARAIEVTGRIIVDLIPRIYDSQRQLSILDEDGEASSVQVNQPNPVVPGQVINDLTQGQYSVVVDVGPSFATRRMEAAQSMLEFINAYPPAAPLIGDMLAKSQDWADADKIAARLQVMLPPQIQMLEAQPGSDPKLAAMAVQIQQMQQAMQQQQQQAGQQMQVLQGHLAQLTTENQKLQVAAAQSKLQGLKMSMDAQADVAEAQQKTYDAQIKAGAEQQRTGIDAYAADSDRLGVVLDFVAKIMTLQQTQAQNVGQEAQQLAPAVESASKEFDQV